MMARGIPPWAAAIIAFWVPASPKIKLSFSATDLGTDIPFS
jgi:hypothetical protein